MCALLPADSPVLFPSSLRCPWLKNISDAEIAVSLRSVYSTATKFGSWVGIIEVTPKWVCSSAENLNQH